MDPMETAQRNFLDAQRRWNADERGDFRLLEICSDAEHQLLAAFYARARPVSSFRVREALRLRARTSCGGVCTKYCS